MTARAAVAEPGFAPEWLHLREPADAAARSAALVERVRAVLGERPLQVHDLGSGTGSMARWLAPLLPNPQHWVLHDHDPALLAAAAHRCAALRDGRNLPVRVETRRTELGRLRPADLAGADLVTASALLDLLTADELDLLAAACAPACCPALLTLSVAGHVELDPPDPRDRAFGAAFDSHQRRTVGGRRLLGPDAPDAATAAFSRHDRQVLAADSPWRLAADRGELIGQWLRGWVAAAAEQAPQLAEPAAAYTADRLRAGTPLRVLVHHRDLLVLPPAAADHSAPDHSAPDHSAPDHGAPDDSAPGTRPA